uniref:Uncharacterized protein n=1 Tax=Zea mays TaxID=4577 RepID=A0A804NEB8_MAIZE
MFGGGGAFAGEVPGGGSDHDERRGAFLPPCPPPRRARPPRPADRDVGEVHIPLSELLSGAPDGPVPAKFVAYQMRKISSGKPQGVLNLSYKLGEFANGYAPAPPPSPPTPSLHRPPRTRLLQARLMPTRLPASRRVPASFRQGRLKGN